MTCAQGRWPTSRRVNANGGVKGGKIELNTLDDGYEPARAAANTKKLIDETRCSRCSATSARRPSAASMPIFTEAKVPFVGPFTGAESLRAPFNRYIFNVRASYFDETEKIVEHLTARASTRSRCSTRTTPTARRA